MNGGIMKKKLLIFYLCFLIISLTPSFSVVFADSLRTDNEVQDNNNQINNANDKIEADADAIEYHSQIIQDTLNHMKDIKWYQFWKWHYIINDGPKTIQDEANMIEKLSKNIGNNGKQLEENANSSIEKSLELADQKSDNNTVDEPYNTGDAKSNVELIKDNVSSYFNNNFSVTEPGNLIPGDIVQYPVSHGNYVYLQYVGMSPRGDKALFLGDTNSAVRLSIPQLENIQYAIKLNKPTIKNSAKLEKINNKFNATPITLNSTTSPQLSYIHNIQELGLLNFNNTQVNHYDHIINSKQHTVNIGIGLMIAGGIIGGIGILLASIAGILFYIWISTHVICGTVLGALSIITLGAAVTIFTCVEIGVETIHIVIGVCVMLSALFAVISAILLPVGGGVYVAGNSGLNNAKQEKIDIIDVCNQIKNDLDSYNAGNTNNLPVSYNISIDAEKNIRTTSSLNSTDVDDDGLLYLLVSNSSNCNIKLNQNGSYEYKPNKDFIGNDSFTYMACDVYGYSNVATVQVNVHPSNHPPLSSNMTFDMETNTSFSNKLKADDIDGDNLTYILINNSLHGNITVNSDGSFNYMPEEGFIGNDSFSYTSCDWKGTGNVATVHLNVHPTNHLPDSNDLNIKVAENENISSNIIATDQDGDNLLYKLIKKPINGTVNLNPNGTFTYTPKKGKIGTDIFKFKSFDWQGGSNIGTVTIEIFEFNHPPVASNISIVTSKNKLIRASFKAKDIDSNQLLFNIVKKPQHGNVTQIGSNKFVYVPMKGYSGKDYFIYRAYDGNKYSELAQVSIKVLKTPTKPRNSLISLQQNQEENQDNNHGPSIDPTGTSIIPNVDLDNYTEPINLENINKINSTDKSALEELEKINITAFIERIKILVIDFTKELFISSLTKTLNKYIEPLIS
jgi:hypothetical protein